MDNNTQTSSLKSWIKAFRLRTLPLALSSTITGSFIAVANGNYKIPVITLALLTTLLLQILSNLANDYGDAVKGTDNENRKGPSRTVQSGEISKNRMKNAVIITALLSLISGLFLLYFSLGNRFETAIFFFAVGVGAIIAAVKYTVGKKAYGYRKLGDLFVFVFFGITGVVGTYYLNTLTVTFDIFLPAISIGLFSVGVLNLNNMRDMDNDVLSGKNTIASQLGWPNAKKYHYILIIAGWTTAFIFLAINYKSPYNLLFIITLPLFLKDLAGISKIKEKETLDPFLKKLAISTFLFSLLLGVGFII
jgi:1,4-dihydroxy-2-naphthoate octaprenyltransferase